MRKKTFLVLAASAALAACGGESGLDSPQGLGNLGGIDELTSVVDPNVVGYSPSDLLGAYQFAGSCGDATAALIMADPAIAGTSATYPVVVVHDEPDGAYLLRGTISPVGTTGYGYQRLAFSASDRFLGANDVAGTSAVASDEIVVAAFDFSQGGEALPLDNYDSQDQPVVPPTAVMSALGTAANNGNNGLVAAGLNHPQGDGGFNIDLDPNTGALYVAEGERLAHEWDPTTCLGEERFDYNLMWQKQGSLGSQGFGATILSLYLPARDAAWADYLTALDALNIQRQVAIANNDGTFDGEAMPAGWSYDRYYDARLGELVRDYRDSVIGPINDHLATLQAEPGYVPFALTGIAKKIVIAIMANEERMFRESVGGPGNFDGTAFTIARGNLHWHWNAVIANNKQP